MTELAVLAGCLLLAWAVVRACCAAPSRQPGSIWFGDGIVDGVLFPLLALLFAVLARWFMLTLLPDRLPIAVFKLVVPILISLAAIRLTVRVLHATFPHSRLMRVFERSVSWIAWIAVVLWITGPAAADAAGARRSQLEDRRHEVSRCATSSKARSAPCWC